MKLPARLAVAAMAALTCVTCLPTAHAQTVQRRFNLLTAPRMKFIPAVQFDGQTVLSYRGSLYNQPDRSTTFFWTGFFDLGGISPDQAQTNLFTGSDQSDNNYIASVLLNRMSNGQQIITFYASCTDNSSSDYFAQSVESFPLSGWHAITVDVVANGIVTPSIKIKLDGVLLTSPTTELGPHRCQFDWTKVATWSVAGDPLYPTLLAYPGKAAEIYAVMDGSVTANDVGQFVTYNPAFGPRAIGLGYLGTRITGNIPQLLLRGGPGYFVLGPLGPDGFAYGFSPNNGGTLHTAIDDPCNVRKFGDGCAPTE